MNGKQAKKGKLTFTGNIISNYVHFRYNDLQQTCGHALVCFQTDITM